MLVLNDPTAYLKPHLTLDSAFGSNTMTIPRYVTLYASYASSNVGMPKGKKPVDIDPNLERDHHKFA